MESLKNYITESLFSENISDYVRKYTSLLNVDSLDNQKLVEEKHNFCKKLIRLFKENKSENSLAFKILNSKNKTTNLTEKQKYVVDMELIKIIENKGLSLNEFIDVYKKQEIIFSKIVRDSNKVDLTKQLDWLKELHDRVDIKTFKNILEKIFRENNLIYGIAYDMIINRNNYNKQTDKQLYVLAKQLYEIKDFDFKKQG